MPVRSGYVARRSTATLSNCSTRIQVWIEAELLQGGCHCGLVGHQVASLKSMLLCACSLRSRDSFFCDFRCRDLIRKKLVGTACVQTRRTGVSFPGTTPDQLTINPAFGMWFTDDHVQPSCGVNSLRQLNVRASACHVGGYGYLTNLARFRDDFGFVLMIQCI